MHLEPSVVTAFVKVAWLFFEPLVITELSPFLSVTAKYKDVHVVPHEVHDSCVTADVTVTY